MNWQTVLTIGVPFIIAATMRRLLPGPLRIATRVTSGYGWRELHGVQNFHAAVDLAAPIGTPVYASQAGRIKHSETTAGGLQAVVTGANGIKTGYAHLDRYATSNDAFVDKGDLIAFTGNTGFSTGPHLHITHYRNGERVDPSLYIDLV